MTLIAAIEHKGRVVLAADSYLGGEEWADLTDRPKFRRYGDLVIGCAGSVRASQVVELCTFRRRRRGEDEFDYILSGVADEIHRAHRVADVPRDQFSAIVAYRGKVYELDHQCGFYRSKWGYHAIGAGAVVAIGSLGSTIGEEPQKRMEKAFLVAERHSAQVAQPIHFVTL